MPTLLATLYFTCWLALSIGRESCFTNSLSSNASKKRSLLPQDKIIKTLTYYKLDKALSQDLIDSAETALRSWSSQPSVFLSQPEQKAVSEAFRDLIGLDVDFAGGFNGAENCRAIFQRAPDVQEEYYGSEELETATERNFNIDEFVAVVNIEGNFLFEKATYNDFKSALTNTLGADKGQIGDIILTGDRGAQVLMLPEYCEAVCSALKQIRSVPVDVDRIELKDLKVKAQTIKELTAVEASLRLDAVASGGFGLSRTKMVSLVEGGDVMIDWNEIKNPAHNVQARYYRLPIYISIFFSQMDKYFDVDGSGNKHSRYWEVAHPGVRIYKQGKVQDQNEEIHFLDAVRTKLLDSIYNSICCCCAQLFTDH